ncbi:hypothetical protein [Reyranella sp.]|uniref:hypothetical protein n=1 Tax=Reyranella sp. TaxID=1929291 RepID=UPI003784D9C6
MAVGANADLVMLDLDAPGMRPVRDPLRSFVFSAADRAVRHVFVDGRQVVKDGTVLTIDSVRAADRRSRMLSGTPGRRFPRPQRRRDLAAELSHRRPELSGSRGLWSPTCRSVGPSRVGREVGQLVS